MPECSFQPCVCLHSFIFHPSQACISLLDLLVELLGKFRLLIQNIKLKPLSSSRDLVSFFSGSKGEEQAGLHLESKISFKRLLLPLLPREPFCYISHPPPHKSYPRIITEISKRTYSTPWTHHVPRHAGGDVTPALPTSNNQNRT